MGICAFYYICNCFGVVVLHRSTVNWRRWCGVCVHWYLCILAYVKLMQSRGLPQMYGRLAERGRVCLHWYLCILLYVKLSWCSDLPEIYAQLVEEGGDSLP